MSSEFCLAMKLPILIMTNIIIIIADKAGEEKLSDFFELKKYFYFKIENIFLIFF